MSTHRHLPPTDPVVQFLAGIILFAHRQAELTAQYLRELGLRPDMKRGRTTAIPKEFALELAAILRIAVWEEAGVLQHLPVDLPQSESALKELWDRTSSTSNEQSAASEESGLSHRVFFVWIQCFAHAGPAELGADLALVGQLDDELMEAIADFLWEHRHLAHE